ncbi:retinal homeobox protein Rx-B-like [Mytilus galloprovincialis]|uniref:homeobox protein zampogna-like n=1 Tax=Mytilus edulis TaxID=6550 RepID=UPI0039EF81E2
MAYQQNAPSKMSFSIEELSKSSRVPETIITDAVVNHIHDIYLPNSSQSCTADIKLSLANSAQRTQYKRKRQDSLHSDDNSFSSTDSSSRDCISPGSCSDDSDKSDQPKKRGRTSYTNSQLLELERYYSNSKYLQIEDRPVLAKKLKLSQHKIKWWFQNRRMKEKRHIKSTSYNGSPELSQFVGVGKPGSRMITTMESNGNFSQQSYSPFPMVSPHTYGMSPFVYPGYSQQFYGSVFPQAVQHNRS